MLNSSKSMEPLWSMSINLKTCRQVATTRSTRAAMKKKKAQFGVQLFWTKALTGSKHLQYERNTQKQSNVEVVSQMICLSHLFWPPSWIVKHVILCYWHGSHCHAFFREFFEHRTPNLGECKCSWRHSFNLRDDFSSFLCFVTFNFNHFQPYIFST